MPQNKYKTELQKVKDLTYFLGIINNLPKPEKRDENDNLQEKIPVILSADDNYSCFVAVTGASILYNTNSFIEFYILSEGITEANKKFIIKTFADITSHFSVKFIDCDSQQYFSDIKLFKGYHVKLNTMNRLLFPMLAPEVKRAIYLDIDLIVLDDIKKLWDEDLEGNIIGAVPLIIDRISIVDDFLKKIEIPEDVNFSYFNSGVMLIDYEKWRNKEGSDKNIIDILINLSNEIKPVGTPDELVLNKYAYINNCYKILGHKYNINPYFSYKWLLENKNSLNQFENKTLEEYAKHIKKHNYYDIIKPQEKPIIRHFFGPEKPWNAYAQSWFVMPYTPHFEDFWFYASITPYFGEIKQRFINKQMYTQDIQEDNTNLIKSIANEVREIIKTENKKKKSKKPKLKKKFYSNSLQKVFSVKNQKTKRSKHKVITIMGAKIKLKQKP
jgi:lipopolysaccharide biosynthesis glycosyltransferase